MSAGEPIRRTNLAGEIANRLRALIEDASLAPGARLGEQALCARFGVSRTPLREALKMLAAEGLVETAPNRGARVARLADTDVDAIFPVMAALEALAGELAASRIDAEALREIRTLHDQMMQAYQRQDRDGYFRINRWIHEKIVEAAGNPALERTLEGLSARVRLARYVTELSQSEWLRSAAEHEAMIEALEKRNGARLALLLKEHALSKADAVKAALAPASETAETAANTAG